MEPSEKVFRSETAISFLFKISQSSYTVQKSHINKFIFEKYVILHCIGPIKIQIAVHFYNSHPIENTIYYGIRVKSLMSENVP